MRHIIALFSAICCFTTVMLAQNKVPAPIEDINKVIDNTPDSIEKARTARPIAGSSRVGNNPVLFLVGNSTMRTGTMGNGDNGQWGWGYFMPEYFDKTKITVENHALGGMSSRTFYTKLWADVVKGIKPGDWVIIELGHNDNGPFDSGRARATIPGIGKDSIEVTIQETGEKETVYTYGEYMRRYVNDVRARGGNPILMSLTPRCAWVDKDSTIVARVDKKHGLWARQVAEAEGVPFVDLNDITATKYERFGKDKVKTMFYIDRIHTSEFGAVENARSAVEGLKGLKDVPLKDWLLPQPVDTFTGRTRKAGRPMVFTIGDSTVRNEDKDEDSMWGWGSVLAEQFDTTRVTVENHAMAGRSARTYLDEGRWDKVYNALQPGDFVLIQFGHNDGGEINTGKARGELHGAGPESKVFKMEATGRNKVVYTYGWYLRKFIMDAREKGATPIIVSHTPRNKWTKGKIESNKEGFGLWALQVARQMNVPFIDLNTITGQKLQSLGEGNVDIYFKKDHTHTSKTGARLNAAGIAQGLRDTNCDLKNYLKPMELDFDLTGDIPVYNEMSGYGYDFNTMPDKKKNSQPFFFSVRVPDGNYKVTLTLGDKKRAANTTVRAESRRLIMENVATKKGKSEERSFIVNKRNPMIDLNNTVIINPREVGTPTWDDKLTLEFTGEAPAVSHIRIEPVEDAPTIFLCGNSTVVDQTKEPWASWGQIFTHYVKPGVAVSNNAESGQRTSSFLASKRLDKVLSMAKPGDWILIEFGHNDEKDKGPGTGPYYNFAHNLKIFIDRARQAGLNPVLLTPTARRHFKGDKIENTHGEYPAAIKQVAEREGVPVLDLTAMSTRLFESLGVEGSKNALVHYPANTFPGQDKALADNTHFNPFGATQVAKCVVELIKAGVPQLSELLVETETFDPSTPDDFETFVWPLAPFYDSEKPYGN
ncbi:MAG: rhamnogalacturonan acetylesterase [Clostridiales bacterium]|nr:rhamnogalacturonan acetylesterase [Clostridiales bacterium]